MRLAHWLPLSFRRGGYTMYNLSEAGKHLIVLVLFIILVSCAAGPKSQSTGEIIDDSVITSKVKGLLLVDEALKAFQVRVETYNGVVLLSGFVDTQKTIDKATEVARSVTGVKSVKNNLVLKQR
jgi:hypothetical protein